jgi:hypothetical protein
MTKTIYDLVRDLEGGNYWNQKGEQIRKDYFDTKHELEVTNIKIAEAWETLNNLEKTRHNLEFDLKQRKEEVNRIKTIDTGAIKEAIRIEEKALRGCLKVAINEKRELEGKEPLDYNITTLT